jgi:hypothetical protein
LQALPFMQSFSSLQPQPPSAKHAEPFMPAHDWHVPPATPHVPDALSGWHVPPPIGSQQLPLQGVAPVQWGPQAPAVHAFCGAQLDSSTQPHVPPSRHALPFVPHIAHVAPVPPHALG